MIAHPLDPTHFDEVATLFAELREEKYFCPHAMDDDTARAICENSSTNRYYGAFENGKIVAYALLRWSDGFVHPSLGIVVRQTERGLGYGKQMMAYLHQQAVMIGSTKIRLRVHPENVIARAMYEQLGYRFSGELDRDELVGWYDLSP